MSEHLDVTNEKTEKIGALDAKLAAMQNDGHKEKKKLQSSISSLKSLEEKLMKFKLSGKKLTDKDMDTFLDELEPLNDTLHTDLTRISTKATETVNGIVHVKKQLRLLR